MSVTTWVTDVTTGPQMASDFNKIQAAYVTDVVNYSRVLAAPVTWADGAALDLFSTTFLQETNISTSTPVAKAKGVANPYKPAIPFGENYLIFPAPPNPAGALALTFRIRLDLEIGSVQSGLVELRRKADSSLIVGFPVSRDADTTTNTLVFPSFIYGANDPFVTGGVRIVLNNTSGQSLRITGTTQVVCFWSNMQLPL